MNDVRCDDADCIFLQQHQQPQRFYLRFVGQRQVATQFYRHRRDRIVTNISRSVEGRGGGLNPQIPALLLPETPLCCHFFGGGMLRYYRCIAESYVLVLKMLMAWWFRRENHDLPPTAELWGEWNWMLRPRSLCDDNNDDEDDHGVKCRR